MCGRRHYENVSHVGIYQNGYILEAVGSLKQIVNGIKPQVQYRKFREVVETYNGEIAFRNPVKPFTFDITQYVGVPYEQKFF